ncbi:UDP-N-acetylmuramoyl-L-alanyl-D-glutamate--2,6-diaminopimelate ligase [Candidatus Berkelbacteria bacterium]|nr:UDP-N-acetylmuramoyl-L-alanyl-D-glutamate--2,6-diaminopimelate ligase [Candidatus Berkelbacteria bacterium]
MKKLIPKQLILFYHYLTALLAAFYYRFPSKKMIVIGVTGTKGKTSTINFIWSCLTSAGNKVGIISTANIRIGHKEVLNKYHMTMPGRFTIQKLMKQMLNEGCKFCIVETTSEGIKQFRHIGIYYDIAVFTNLTPEHLDSHGGSFEKYKQTKAKMFSALSKHRKIIDGKLVEKVIVANADDEHAKYYLKFSSDKKITFSLSESTADVVAKNINETKDEVAFEVGDSKFKIKILGKFNVYNALPAIIIARLFNAKDKQIENGLKELTKIPGRMEFIDNDRDFSVIVDYAHEKVSLTNVLEVAKNLKKPNSKIILLLGAEGGGRDKSKRPIMGEIAAKNADVVIVSNVDPYDDKAQQIIEDIAVSAEKFGKVRDKDIFTIEDRRSGINKALSLAKSGDIVLITGKGAEQSLVIGGKKIQWDDRTVTREELEKLSKARHS